MTPTGNAAERDWFHTAFYLAASYSVWATLNYWIWIQIMQEALALPALKWDRLHNEVRDRCPLTGAELKQWGSQTGCNFTLGRWQMERDSKNYKLSCA